MRQENDINIKYIEKLRELTKPVSHTAKVISSLCNTDICDCQLSPVIEYFTKQLADYLDSIYNLDYFIKCSDWYGENVLPNCLEILLSNEPVEKMIHDNYEEILEGRICDELKKTKQRGDFCGA